MDNNRRKLAEALRERTEERLRKLSYDELLALDKIGLPEAIFKLAANRLELDIQNKELQRAKQAAASEERRYRSLFEFTPTGLVISDDKGIIVELNSSFLRLLKLSRTELLGKSLLLLVDGKNRDEFRLLSRRIIEDSLPESTEIALQIGDGSQLDVQLKLHPYQYPDKAGDFIITAVEDITERKKNKSQLELAHFDVLTDLPNRTLLLDRLQQAMAVGKRRKQLIAVAFIDLDGFKQVNDELGHGIGDGVLVNLSRRFQEILRAEDTIARLGGDEFVAMFIGLNTRNECIPLIKRLLEQASLPVHAGGHKFSLSSSIGVTFYPQAKQVKPGELLRQADQAMYQAKSEGKNRYKLFDVAPGLADRGIYENRERIRQALSRKEIVLFYQPKVNMRTGTVTGVEALIRWRHPERGLLSPEMFLLPIENDSLAVEIELWVISEAVRQMNCWLESGLQMSISVNIGPWHLEQNNFLAVLQSILSRYPALPHHLLELEVLESSFLLDISRVANAIKVCSEIGVAFALDDFGTGYSSLTHLRQLPVQTLKIDQSFVKNMLENSKDLAIVDGVIGLSRAFEKSVIAEGVEADEHCEILLQLGCELAQGYGIAQPMPEAEFREWLRAWRPNPNWQHIKPISVEHHSLLVASIRHQLWLRTLKSCLKGEQPWLAGETLQTCRFGAWLENEGKLNYGNHPEFSKLVEAHDRVHRLAASLCHVTANGETSFDDKSSLEVYRRLIAENNKFALRLRQMCA